MPVVVAMHHPNAWIVCSETKKNVRERIDGERVAIDRIDRVQLDALERRLIEITGFGFALCQQPSVMPVQMERMRSEVNIIDQQINDLTFFDLNECWPIELFPLVQDHRCQQRLIGRMNECLIVEIEEAGITSLMLRIEDQPNDGSLGRHSTVRFTHGNEIGFIAEQFTVTYRSIDAILIVEERLHRRNSSFNILIEVVDIVKNGRDIRLTRCVIAIVVIDERMNSGTNPEVR